MISERFRFHCSLFGSSAADAPIRACRCYLRQRNVTYSVSVNRNGDVMLLRALHSEVRVTLVCDRRIFLQQDLHPALSGREIVDLPPIADVNAGMSCAILNQLAPPSRLYWIIRWSLC